MEGARLSYSAAFSPDGAQLATGGQALHIWDVRTGKEQLGSLSKESFGFCSLSLSPNGRVLAIGCQNGMLHLWDVAADREITKFQAHKPGEWPSLAFSPDGKTLASSQMDWTVRVWEVTSGKERERFDGKRSMTDRVAFSPDGRFLAFGGTDKAVNIYDLTAGEMVHTFKGHDGWIISLAFSPDGTRLVSSSQDATALVWDMAAVRPAVRPKEADLSADERDALWDRLADRDAAAAGKAVRSLLASPRQAAALLGDRLRPARAADAEEIARLIRDLDDDDIDVRERADARLAARGADAAPALRKALEGGPSAEVRRRVERLLKALGDDGPSPERLRAARAVEVLERLGTPAAKEALGRLADGAADVDLTRDAKDALRRLAARTDKTP